MGGPQKRRVIDEHGLTILLADQIAVETSAFNGRKRVLGRMYSQRLMLDSGNTAFAISQASRLFSANARLTKIALGTTNAQIARINSSSD